MQLITNHFYLCRIDSRSVSIRLLMKFTYLKEIYKHVSCNLAKNLSRFLERSSWLSDSDEHCIPLKFLDL